MTDETHDPQLRSWVDAANSADTDFPIQNLPFGVFRRGRRAEPNVGVAIGDHILDLRKSAELGLLEGTSRAMREAAESSTLNALMALEHRERSALRRHLVKILGAAGWGADRRALVPMREASMMVPAAIGDYTDFYASIFHATAVGQLFRPDSPLLPNYKHVPIAYHGRSSSIVASDTPIRRPWGQVKGAGNQPAFRASERLDYEAEIGFFVGPGNQLGAPVSIADAERHIFGLCLVNDWSARDIQAWEYQPLGPFLSKNFATTVSPWVITLDALAPFRCPAFTRPPGDPRPMPYLLSPSNEAEGGIDIAIEVFLRTAEMRRAHLAPARLSRASFREMYWTAAQLLAHHTCNGCNLRPADLLASGTISGADDGTAGCLLEITRGGQRALELPSGETRTFLADGDEVILRAQCERQGFVSIGFGECAGVVLGSGHE
jgi:fumarylacetoacetase